MRVKILNVIASLLKALCSANLKKKKIMQCGLDVYIFLFFYFDFIIPALCKVKQILLISLPLEINMQGFEKNI